MHLEGTAALITGGASGLGAATARSLASAGCRVVIADIDDTGGTAIAAEVGGTYVRADTVVSEDVATAVTTASSFEEPLRIAVACAGIGPGTRTLGRDGSPHDADVYRRVIEVNQTGTFQLLRHAAAAIASQEPLGDGERGVVILTSSTAAVDGPSGMLAYSASKGAVSGMVVPAARDLATLGIRICCILPGTFDTPLLATATPSQKQKLAADTLFPRRLGRPDEFAAVVRLLAEVSYFNAASIRLDGGLRVGAPRS